MGDVIDSAVDTAGDIGGTIFTGGLNQVAGSGANGGKGGGVNVQDVKQLIADQQAYRAQDLAQGKARGEELFSNGALGRLQEGRSPEVANILAQRQANAQGLTPEEMNAYRSQNVGQIQGATQGSLRQLKAAQAQAGLHGAAASAQQGKVLMGGNQAMANSERDLFAQNAALKRSGLDSYSSDVGKAEGQELGKQQYNIGQQNKETYGQLATELGYGSLGSADRGAAMQTVVGQQQALAAQKNSGKK